MCAAASFSVGWHLAKHCRKRKTRTRVEDVDQSQTGGHRQSKLEKEHRGLWDMRHRKRIDSYLAAVLHSRVSVKQPSQIQETIVPSFGDTPHPWNYTFYPLHWLNANHINMKKTELKDICQELHIEICRMLVSTCRLLRWTTVLVSRMVVCTCCLLRWTVVLVSRMLVSMCHLLWWTAVPVSRMLVSTCHL